MDEHVQRLNREKKNRIDLLQSIWNEVDRIADEYKIPIEPTSSLNKLSCFGSQSFNHLQVDLPIDNESIHNIRLSLEKVNTIALFLGVYVVMDCSTSLIIS